MSCRCLLGAVIATHFLPLAVEARPAHKKALADYLGPFLAKKLDDCRTCHLPDKPGAAVDEDDKPHNAFGVRLKAVKNELKKARKPTNLAARRHRRRGQRWRWRREPCRDSGRTFSWRRR